jgi:hypothetical protein
LRGAAFVRIRVLPIKTQCLRAFLSFSAFALFLCFPPAYVSFSLVRLSFFFHLPLPRTPLNLISSDVSREMRNSIKTALTVCGSDCVTRNCVQGEGCEKRAVRSGLKNLWTNVSISFGGMWLF